MPAKRFKRGDEAPEVSRTIFTIGHSTRTIADFVALLRQVDVDLLVDVRSIPGSRAMPQFNIETLPDSLSAEGIGYQHLGSLGGRRHHKKGAPPSTNTFWRVAARGVPVEHILGLGQVTLATLTPGARVLADGTLRYPPPDGDARQ